MIRTTGDKKGISAPKSRRFPLNEHFRWVERLRGTLGLLTEEQRFILHRHGTGASFEQTEHFSGILALLFH